MVMQLGRFVNYLLNPVVDFGLALRAGEAETKIHYRVDEKAGYDIIESVKSVVPQQTHFFLKKTPY